MGKNIIPFISEGELSDDDVKVALIEFFDYYQQKFGYELESAINYFINTWLRGQRKFPMIGKIF